MEGQAGKILATTQDKIIIPKGDYVTIFKNTADGIYYGKKPDGTIEPIAGGSGNFIAAVGVVSFPGVGIGIGFIDTAVPEAIQASSIVLITERGQVSTNDFSYEIPVDGTLRIWSSNLGNAADVVYTIIN